jgi:hypothetical protein
MTEKEFCIWLKGYIEIHQFTPNATEWGVICEKLKGVEVDTYLFANFTQRGQILGNPPSRWGDGGILNTNNPSC